ncbi:MAG: preprotein translocase subunit YajC [Rhodospirillales bacterium CG15_BIG_FIL_POST_REV_8_21_14_020_66_15]|nr:MAG: preprotein translocase subunit YajC [Rhodospirillales bacterium CG15_BIG_FIL_POST_REV_8_21_14_020_66_15]
MLISPAYAQAAGGGGGGGIEAFLPLILIFVIFYFLLIRPQQKKMKEHKAMLEAVRRGDKVVTGGGIMGTVTKVNEGDEVVVEIAEGIKVKVRKSMLSSVESKSEPQAPAGKGDAANDAGGNTVEKKAGGLRGLLGGGKKDG